MLRWASVEQIRPQWAQRTRPPPPPPPPLVSRLSGESEKDLGELSREEEDLEEQEDEEEDEDAEAP